MISPPKHWQHWPRFCKRLFGLFVQNVGRALQRYGLIDGEQCAASFAYYAFLFSFSTHSLMRGHRDTLRSRQQSDGGRDSNSARPISPLARERSCFAPAHRPGSDYAWLGGRCARLFGSCLELFALFPNSSGWSQSSLGIARLQLVETPAEESFDDRNCYQRNRAWASYALRIR